jgi:hypothetical protein
MESDGVNHERATRIVVHIGTHKTGTTSIQRYLQDNLDSLRAHRTAIYQGLFSKENHIELHLLSQRRERTSAYKYLNPNIDYEHVLRQTKQGLRSFFMTPRAKTFVFLAEGLAYLRHVDETARLKELLGDASNVEIVVYLREKQRFLASYKNQLDKMGIPLSDDATAFNYVEEDSWLVDYDSLVAAYRAVFANVKVLSYDSEIEKNPNVIASFYSILGVQPSVDYRNYLLNSRQVPSRFVLKSGVTRSPVT